MKIRFQFVPNADHIEVDLDQFEGPESYEGETFDTLYDWINGDYEPTLQINKDDLAALIKARNEA